MPPATTNVFMSAPVFSIITVCYQSERTLGRTLESVRKQTFQDYEYLVIDGGSSDATVSILRDAQPSFGGRMHWVSEPDRGIYHAMNKGIARARGACIGIINSDDWYEPGCLEEVSRHLRIGSGVLHGLVRYWDGKIPQMILGRYPVFEKASVPLHPATFVAREVYQKFGSYDESLRSAADLELLLRLQREGCRFQGIDKVLANFSEGGISYSLQGKVETELVKARFGLISEMECRDNVDALTRTGTLHRIRRGVMRLLRQPFVAGGGRAR